MTTPATAIKHEIRELIGVQIETFGQKSPLTPFELSECRHRAERIKRLGQELDRIGARDIPRSALWQRSLASLGLRLAKRQAVQPAVADLVRPDASMFCGARSTGAGDRSFAFPKVLS